MKPALLTTIILGLTALTGAPAHAADPSTSTDKQCFYIRKISGFDRLDDHHLMFYGATQHLNYLVQTAEPCFDRKYNRNVQVDLEGKQICTQNALRYVYTPYRQCRITLIQPVESLQEAKSILSTNTNKISASQDRAS